MHTDPISPKYAHRPHFPRPHFPQKAALEHGLEARLFDPSAAEFLGVDAFKVVAGLAGKLTAATREGSFGGTGTGSPAQGGYEYAVQASTNKDHPDYAKYWAGDKEVVRRVNEGWKQMPKGSRWRGAGRLHGEGFGSG